MTPFTVRRRVEFCETDLAGMMHFSNYYRFMEFAEQEFLRSKGLSVTWREGDIWFGFPRVSASCDFILPARFEQVLEISVTLDRLGEKSATYGFEFRHEGEVIARGAMTSVCCQVSANGGVTSIAVPPSFRAGLARVP